mmetsp:Transcript_58237/g.126469  ORF Transcript_58237/g.126469 Transcript_58237/m.126469 type:complete len:357 (+) Transcript_58237:955-2025(+)
MPRPTASAPPPRDKPRTKLAIDASRRSPATARAYAAKRQPQRGVCRTQRRFPRQTPVAGRGGPRVTLPKQGTATRPGARRLLCLPALVTRVHARLPEAVCGPTSLHTFPRSLPTPPFVLSLSILSLPLPPPLRSQSSSVSLCFQSPSHLLSPLFLPVPLLFLFASGMLRWAAEASAATQELWRRLRCTGEASRASERGGEEQGKESKGEEALASEREPLVILAWRCTPQLISFDLAAAVALEGMRCCHGRACGLSGLVKSTGARRISLSDHRSCDWRLGSDVQCTRSCAHLNGGRYSLSSTSACRIQTLYRKTLSTFLAKAETPAIDLALQGVLLKTSEIAAQSQVFRRVWEVWRQ